ncbi:MAG: hypothetical protein ACREVF_01060 [Burkholderiales bacterium]
MLHGLTRPGVFARSEKAHGGKKPPCVLLKMLGFSAAIFIRFGIWMQAFSAAFGPARPLLNTCLSCGTLWLMVPAFDSLDRLQSKVESESSLRRRLRNLRYCNNDTHQDVFASTAGRPRAGAVNSFPRFCSLHFHKVLRQARGKEFTCL